MAAFNAIQECVWVKGVMDEIGLALDRPITLFMDSKSAICLANNPIYHILGIRVIPSYNECLLLAELELMSNNNSK